jgi:hypothetical protein
MTAFSAQLHQHQLNLIQQMGKYQNSVADYNFQKLIRYYKDAINSAQTSQEARGLAESLQGVLAQKGQGLADVQGLNTNLLNGNQNQANPNQANPIAGKADAGKQKGSEEDKKIIADLSQEYGIDVKKAGTTKDWLEKAKTDQNVRVLDNTGKDVTAEREGRIKKGDILEVNSKQHGLVRISVGGDGEINGGDDKVIMKGGQAAAGNMMDGLNQINNVPGQQQANPAQPNAVNNLAQALGITPDQAVQNQLAMNPDATNQQALFTEAQIKSLIAAILNQSLSAIEQRQYMQQMQQVF